MKKIVIPLPPVTKKNHQRIVRGRYGAPMVLPSAQYEAYQQAAAWHCKGGETIAEPVEVKCLFYMPTRRKVDLTNLLEAIDDILVYAGTLADDNSSIIVSHDGSRVLYDKENPRTEVYISRDTHSIAYLYECLEKLAEEINEGRIKRKHIKDVLKDECGVVFGD